MSVKLISSKVIAGLLVLGVILILVYSGPAQAFVLSLQIPENSVDQGAKIKVNLKVDTENGDNPSDVSYLIFKMNGPDDNDIECRFLPDGEIISGCDEVEIKKINTQDTGYCKSYGYGEGCSLEYAITIDSSLFEVGNYTTFLIINAKEKDIVQKGKDILINIPGKVCSIRANNGNVQVDEMEFINNKINYYIPLNNAERGQGYLTGQDGRDRFNFKFKVDEVLNYTNDLIKAQVSGKYRIGSSGRFIEDSGILTLDRIQNVTSFAGNDINMNGMKVYFRRFC